MRKTLIIIVMVILVFLVGCFEIKDVSYTDTDTNVQNGSTSSQTDSDKKTEFKFSAKQILYLEENDIQDDSDRSNGNNSSSSEQEKNKIPIKTSFESIEEFDQYIQELKKYSDTIMEIIDRPGYTTTSINKAVKENKSLLEVIKKIKIPQTKIKTKDGRYFAEKYGRDELESLVVLRGELLENVGKSIGKSSKTLEFKINALQNGSIPNKEGSFNFARQNMMVDEGYIWDNTQKKYILKPDSE